MRILLIAARILTFGTWSAAQGNESWTRATPPVQKQLEKERAAR